MKKILAVFCIVSLFVGCKGRNEAHDDWSKARQQMEVRGQELLAEARLSLSKSQFQTARQHINTLRKECDLAFDARQQGILLLDSIDLQEAIHDMMATDSLLRKSPLQADSLRWALEEYNNRIKFYRRKLEHDKRINNQSVSTNDKQRSH